MENKKLVNILLKDMGELEELVAEIKGKGNFDSLEIEFLHTRARGIMQLLQMLNGHENYFPGAIPEEITGEKGTGSVGGNPVKEEEINIPESENENTAPEVEIKQEPGNVPEEPVEGISGKENAEGRFEDEVKEEGSYGLDNEDIKLDEKKIMEPNQRLGDSFLKGKSVNDLVHDQNKLEFKLSNRPVSSIRSSIGINDRFQYIRELFDGSSERFLETVTSLDEMNNINEAVSYLQQNFRWKKNETSLKFVNLIKRRFTHA
jgi:hypothetical protein